MDQSQGWESSPLLKKFLLNQNELFEGTVSLKNSFMKFKFFIK